MYQKVTKSYLPSHLCESSDGSDSRDSSESSDSSDSGDSSDSYDSSDLKTLLTKTIVHKKNIFFLSEIFFFKTKTSFF